ncbi:sphingomyelin phosphodiesterase-like protein 2, partial [Dinothrombium tinctorium]
MNLDNKFPTTTSTVWNEAINELWQLSNEWIEENNLPCLTKYNLRHKSTNINVCIYPEPLMNDYLRLCPVGNEWHILDHSIRKSSESFHFPPEFKQRNEKLIYLSMGSTGSNIVELMSRLVKLLANCKHKIIVVRGKFHDQYELAENMWGEPFLRQLEIIPLVDLVITHGGNNTFVETLYFGKPMIILPLLSDQHDNAQRAVESKIGVRFNPFLVEERELLKAIDDVLNDDEIKQNVQNISKKMKKSKSMDVLVQRIEEMIRNPKIPSIIMNLFSLFSSFPVFLLLFLNEIEARQLNETENASVLLSLLASVLKNNESQILEDLFKGRASKVTCDACILAIELGKKLMVSEHIFELTFETICSLLEIETSEVCKGMASLYGPQLYFIMRHSKLSAKEMCAQLISPDCMPRIDFIQSKCVWSLEIPPKKTTTRQEFAQNDKTEDKESFGDWLPLLPPKTRSTLKALHLTDFHLDLNYVEGSYAYCQEPLCCMINNNRTDQSTFAGHWGSYGNCDLPLRTIETSLTYINELHNFDYIMYTGDILPHLIWKASEPNNVLVTSTLATLFQKYFGSYELFLPAVGNHESLPVNMFPPPSERNPFDLKWLYETLYEQWKQWIPENSVKSFKYGGYYVKNITRSLKAIVMNTNFCARLNFWQLLKPNDIGRQLEWLATELQKAEDSHQYVHLIGHIAPDKVQCNALWLHHYLRILERYNETIRGQFFGHTHFDEFRVYKTATGDEPLSVAFIGGSLTTYENVNPMFRIYTTTKNGIIKDYETFYFNLTEANNLLDDGQLPWRKEYSAIQSYNLIDQSPLSYKKLSDRMQSNDALFDKYYVHYHRYSDAKNWPKICRDD